MKNIKFYKSIFIALLLALFLAGIYLIVIWDSNSDPIGEANSKCAKTPIMELSNSTGLVVSAYNTVCDVAGGNSAIYVHIHKKDEVINRKTLVFRYFDIYNIPPPKIKWMNDHHLFIEVGNVTQVTKKIDNLRGVEISYSIGAERFPLETR
ncbi:hypothetical protein GTP91_24810 [Rugamonas sp. FT82W]|uniref:Uncharacterized protein n=1 Tax=Duganella vulcania TaxID=2692166 RepID=A0A845G9W5_9BURK|nr:hypothetical protein [Duganella vulcania]MYM90380.1 hypothetical protein [Duganella vulcania]